MLSAELSDEILDVLPLMIRVIRGQMRGAAQPHLTIAQFRVLGRLSHAPQTNKQLADWIGISTPSMFRTVEVLEKNGLVNRHSAKRDRREVLVSLTVKGKNKFAGFRKTTKRMLVEKLSALSAKDRKELCVGLSHLRGVFEQ